MGYHHRWHAGHREIAKTLETGRIGKPVHLRAAWIYPSPPDDWRNRGTAGKWWSLAALGTHLVDLAWWLMEPSCGAITAASCVTSKICFGGRDECAAIQLRFASGATAQLFVAMYGTPIREFDILGTEGSFRADWTLGGSGRGRITFTDHIYGGGMALIERDPYAAELQDFTDAIRGDREPEVGGSVGLRNVELLTRLSEG